MPHPNHFGEKLRTLRHEHKMTQDDLARALGLGSSAHIANLEAGRRTPSIDLVLRIAAMFQISANSLLQDAIPVPAITAGAIRDILIPVTTGIFGRNLRSLRREHKMTQDELAKVLGLASSTHIANLEAGRRTPSVGLLLHVADLFGVTTDFLLYQVKSEEDPAAASETKSDA